MVELQTVMGTLKININLGSMGNLDRYGQAQSTPFLNLKVSLITYGDHSWYVFLSLSPSLPEKVRLIGELGTDL